MRLIYHNIRHIRHFRTSIRLPPFRIGFTKINYRSPLSVHTYRFCKNTRRLKRPLAVLERTNGIILAFQIPLHGSLPEIVCIFLKTDYCRCIADSIIIDAHLHLLGNIRPKRKLGFLGTIEALILHFRLLVATSYTC